MSYTRAFSADLVASLLELDGNDKWTVCVEAEFGSRIADDGSGGADTAISWNATHVLFQTSVDGGQTWLTVPQPGVSGSRKIPGLDVGQTVTNGAVLVRAFFYRPTSRLVSVSTTVNLVNGDSFTAAANWATFEGIGAGASTLSSVGLKSNGARVMPAASHGATGFNDTRILRRQNTPPDTEGPKSGTHVSRGIIPGVEYFSGVPIYVEIQDVLEEEEDNPRFAKAAMGWEAWVYFPAEPTVNNALCDWRTGFGIALDDDFQYSPGTTIYITEDGKFTFEFAPHAISLRNQNFETLEEDLQGNIVLHTTQGSEMKWANQWRHVAVSYDGLGVSLFVDGSLVAAQGANAGVRDPQDRDRILVGGYVIPTDGDFQIGGSHQPLDGARTTFPFEGVMAEARLWGRSINPQQLMRRRLSVAEAAAMQADRDLAACWPLVNSAEDITPAGVHLTQEGVGFTSVPEAFVGTIPPRTTVTPGDPPVRVGRWDINMMDISVDSNVFRICSGTSQVDFPDGRAFTPAGNLLSIGGTVRERGEVDPDQGMTFELTGLDPALRSIAMNAAYQDRPIRIYIATQNEGGGLIGDPVLLWEGRMDQLVPAMRTEGEGDKQQVVLTIGLRAETSLRDFDRESGYRWNKEAHRALYPDDAGLDEVADVSERQVVWPRQADLDQSEAP